MRPLANFIMKGRIHAAGIVLLLTLLSWILPLVSVLAVAALALPTLRNGSKEGGIILLVALAGLVIFGGYLLGSPGDALVYGLILWGPAGILAVILRETRSLSLTVMAAAVVGMFSVLVAYGVLDNPATFWLDNFREIARPALEQAPDADTAELLERFARFSPYLTGVVALGSVLSVMLSLFLARWWQALLYNPGGFAQEFAALTLPKPMAYGLMGMILAASLGSSGFSEITWNLAQPALAPFLFAGFALLHRWLEGRAFWLQGFYVLLLIMPYVVLPVILLGFADTLLNLRQRPGIDRN